MSVALLSRSSSRAFDAERIRAGVPGSLLMENAGRGAAEVLLSRLGDALARPVIVGGLGQNGGDAWVVARRLVTLGHAPRCFVLGARDNVSGDAAIAIRALEALGVSAIEIRESQDALHAALRDASAIVDGVFGTGLDRAIEGWRAAALAAMAASGVPVFALDLPSGVDADTGAVHGVAVPARLTATFAGYKRGHLTGPGRGLSGDVVVVDIGVPPPPAHDRVLELADAAAWLPARANDAHKGTAGHALVLAGEAGKSGAALLGGHGALRGGAGLVTLAVPRSAQSAYDARVLELMTASVTDAGSIRALAEGKRAVVLGPGFGLEPERRSLAVELARTLEPVTILDADALTAIGGDLGSLSGAPLRVLTPHPGEAARLLGSTTEAVQADRFGAAAALAERSGQLVVLKGAGTIVAQGGRCAVCPLGTPALGVAGTGDVLAGAIAAVIDGSAAFETACAAVLLHARAGELAAHTDRGLLAREVGDALPVALAEARLTR